MTAWLLLLLTASPVVTVAVPGFRSGALKPDELHSIEQRFVILAQNPGVRFVTADDISTLLGLERQKQLIGCANNECLTELSNALGADLVLNADVGQLGDEYIFNLRALRPTTGEVVYSASNRFKNVGTIDDWIASNAPDIGLKLANRESGSPSGSSLLRASPVIIGSVGVAALVTGGVLFGASKSEASALRNRTGGNYDSIAAHGQTNESLGVGFLIGGGVLTATGVLFWLSGATSSAPQLAFAPVPGGATVVVGGSF